MLAFLTLSTAYAASNQIAFELGWLGNRDPRWGMFAEGRSYGTAGLRVGYAVHDRVAVIAGWQHGNTGMDVGTYDYDEDDGESTTAFSSPELHTAFYGDQVTLGAKADVKLFKWLHPYAAAQAVALVATFRLDDDTGDDENLTQVRRTGATGGVLATAGLDFPIHVHNEIAISPYLEMGYGWLAPVAFEDVGALKFDGFAGRAGVALHF